MALYVMLYSGADPGFDRGGGGGGGAQIVTGLKLPFWGLSFVEFWCWGLIFGGRGGGPGPRAPLDPPLVLSSVFVIILIDYYLVVPSQVWYVQLRNGTY